jgi:hypothetical protein
MRKIAGTLALAIVATIVATGAQTATATTLCNVNESPCPTEHVVKTVHFINNTTMQILFEQLKPITCSSALLEAEVLAGSPLTLDSTILVFGGCSFANTGCTVWSEEEMLPSFLLSVTGANLGSLAATNGEINVSCASGKFTCQFGLSGLELPMEGALHREKSGNGMITSEKVKIPKASPFCLGATLDLLLEPLEPIYIF